MHITTYNSHNMHFFKYCLYHYQLNAIPYLSETLDILTLLFSSFFLNKLIWNFKNCHWNIYLFVIHVYETNLILNANKSLIFITISSKTIKAQSYTSFITIQIHLHSLWINITLFLSFQCNFNSIYMYLCHNQYNQFKIGSKPYLLLLYLKTKIQFHSTFKKNYFKCMHLNNSIKKKLN